MERKGQNKVLNGPRFIGPVIDAQTGANIGEIKTYTFGRSLSASAIWCAGYS